MARNWRPGVRIGRTAAGIVTVLVLLLVAGGAWVGSGGLSPRATPLVVYVTPGPGSTVAPTSTIAGTSGADPSGFASASPIEATATVAPGADSTAAVGPTPAVTATPVPTPPPAPTPAVTPFHPTPTPEPQANLLFGERNNPSPICQRNIHLTIYVTNEGPQATTSPTIARLVDTYNGTQTEEDLAGVPTLSSGQSYLIAWDITVHTGCGEAHVLVARLDPSNTVRESNEMDNILTFPYTLATGPDLVASTLGIAPSPPVCGHDFGATIVVTNLGPAASPHDGIVTFGDTVATATGSELVQRRDHSFPTLAAGSSYTVTVIFNIGTHCGETHLITATIDLRGDLGDVDWTNNTVQRSYGF